MPVESRDNENESANDEITKVKEVSVMGKHDNIDHDKMIEVEENVADFVSNDIDEGTYIVVQFSTKKTVQYFIEMATEITNDDQYTLDDRYIVKFMKKTSLVYVFPDIDDTSLIDLSNIKTIQSYNR